MASNYQEITKYNEDQLGKDTASRKSQVNMYSDFSHFVYEILQNADDYGATEISFELTEDKLTIEHNGTPFTVENVKAISYFGQSTSRDDLIKTGRFGLGFKSVFAFTASPSVFSGEEAFEIYSLYRLKALPKPSDLDINKTRIVLPFNHLEMLPDYVETHIEKEKAFYNISERLAKLDIITLLFTKNIKQLKWAIHTPTGKFQKGRYVRTDREVKNFSNTCKIRKTEIEDGKTLKVFIVYSRPIKWNREKHKPVDIGFSLNNKGKKNEILQIKRPLVVLFQTTVDTRLGFLINGPFRTPAHRETVSQNDKFNEFLVKQISKLLIETMSDIKKKNLLTISFLSILPIRTDDFPVGTMLYPVVEAVREAFLNEDFLPTDDGSFVKAKNAKLADSADIRKLLSKEQLNSLFQSTDGIKWLTPEINQDRTPDLKRYLLEQLKIEEVKPKKFAELLKDSFLEEQNDNWIIYFYSFLGRDRSELWKKPDAALRNKKFIRLENDSHVIPFKPDGTPNAYLPSLSSLKTNYPTIKRSIFADNAAADFLKNLGIMKPDLFTEIIEFVLPKYDDDSLIVEYDENIEDLKKIKELMKEPPESSSSAFLARFKVILGKLGLAKYEDRFSHNNLTPETINYMFFKNVLPKAPILWSHNGHKIEYKNPQEIYSNSPELHFYFQDNPEPWFICDDYPGELEPLFIGLEINQLPKITKRVADENGFVIIKDYRSNHSRGLNGFDPDIIVDGLSSAITNPTMEKSKFIWNAIALPCLPCIRGFVEKSKYKTYEANKKGYKKNEKVSAFGSLLIDKAWLPGPYGKFHEPRKISLEDLPTGFEKDTPQAKELALALQMKQPEQVEALEIVTRGDEKLKMLIEHYQSASDADREKLLRSIPTEAPPELSPSFKEGLKKLGRLQQGTPLEERDNKPVSDPERYQDKLNETVKESVELQKSQTRRISFSPVRDLPSNAEARSFLYEQYQGRCQVTGFTFPKASQRTSEAPRNYFEACALISSANAFYQNNAGNMLCVSADTMAKFKFASIEFLENIEDTIEKFKEKKDESGEVFVRIRLAGEDCAITWSQRHFMRLVALYDKA